MEDSDKKINELNLKIQELTKRVSAAEKSADESELKYQDAVRDKEVYRGLVENYFEREENRRAFPCFVCSKNKNGWCSEMDTSVNPVLSIHCGWSIQRLRSTVYAIDFDGTIVEENWPKIGKLKQEAVEFIERIRREGNKWILYTMREGEQLKDAVSFLEANGLTPDAVNDNLPERISVYGDNPRKIGADVYIDDRNAGGLFFP